MADRERIEERRAEIDRRTERAFRSMPSWRTRTRRRGLVVLAVAVLACMLAWTQVQPRDLLWPLVGIVVFGGLMVALRVLTRAVAETPRARLDERDRALRDAAWRRAYIVTLVALALLYVFVRISEAQDLVERAQEAGLWLLMAGISAPTLALAWTLEDDDPADTEDDDPS